MRSLESSISLSIAAFLPDLTEPEVRDMVSSETFEKGRERFEEGAVRWVDPSKDARLQAIVDGSRDASYSIVLFRGWNGKLRRADCSCSYRGPDPICRHVVALLLALTEAARREEDFLLFGNRAPDDPIGPLGALRIHLFDPLAFLGSETVTWKDDGSLEVRIEAPDLLCRYRLSGPQMETWQRVGSTWGLSEPLDPRWFGLSPFRLASGFPSRVVRALLRKAPSASLQTLLEWEPKQVRTLKGVGRKTLARFRDWVEALPDRRPPAVDTEPPDLLNILTDWPIARRFQGLELLDGGAVRSWWTTEAGWLEGKVDDWKGFISWDPGHPRATDAGCNCRTGDACAHTAALLLAHCSTDRGGAAIARHEERSVLTGPLFSASPAEQEADIAHVAEGNELRVRVSTETIDLTCRLGVSRAPLFLEVLNRLPGEDLRLPNTCRIESEPLTPGLSLDYDEEENLCIRPFFDLPDGGEESRISGSALPEPPGWIHARGAYRRVVIPPEQIASYFDEEETVLTGDAIPEFLFDTLPDVEAACHIERSPAVQETLLLPEPELDRVTARTDGENWFQLAPLYRSGDFRFTTEELEAWRLRGGMVRRGNRYIRPPSSDPSLSVETADGERVSTLTLLQLRAEWEERGVDFEPDGEAAELLARFDRSAEHGGAPEAPPGMVSTLRPYQRVGYGWLRFLHELGLGGILADDMGLGKTHQVMALLAHLHLEEGKTQPSLVLCPRSVLDHWIKKLEEHVPDLPVFRYHGRQRFDAWNASKARVLITTYGTFLRDAKTLSKEDWTLFCLDEAQAIKNPRTRIARAVRTVGADQTIALTGTPVENRPAELWSILEQVCPGYLGSHEQFRTRYEQPILRGDAKKRTRLRRLVHPFCLRRVKEEVLDDLPEKVIDERTCRLTRSQVALYENVVRGRAAPLVESLKRPDDRIQYLHIFTILGLLKQICCHPALVSDAPDLTSGKFELFKGILEEALEAERKIVIFSQYLGMLDIIAEHLTSREVPYTRLQGDTRDRAGVIERFQTNEECRIILCSLLAGGLGIDLTAADIVIHYDRWWNAARERQATDRVHRIGQKRSVQVIKLITEGTLEERIDSLIKQKEELADALVQTDGTGLKRFDKEELLSLLSAPE